MLETDSIDLPARHRDGLRRYLQIVQQEYGSSLISIAAYGHALWGERWGEKSGDHPDHRLDTVVILADDDLGRVRALAAHLPSLRRSGIAAPLVMPADALIAARDSYPLELLDIQQCHLPLVGEDRFAAMVFAREHVRLQCERELRTLAIALRQRVLLAHGSAAPPTADLLPDLVRALRGLIWLRRVDRRTGPEVLAAAPAALAKELPGIARLAAGAGGWETYEALYRDVVALGRASDGW